MKSRLLIIIGLLAVLIFFVVIYEPVFVATPFSNENQSEQQPHASDERLQSVLYDCKQQELFVNGKMITEDGKELRLTQPFFDFFNGTHYINNNNCELQKITKYPGTNNDCIPYIDKWMNSEIKNDTHIYNQFKCEWEEEFSWEKEYEN